MIAVCDKCGKELPNDDHYAYEGKAYHLACLPAEAREAMKLLPGPAAEPKPTEK